MGFLLGAWGLGTFIAYKVIYEFLFYNHSITLIASLLLAMLTSGFIFLATARYAKKLFFYNVAPQPRPVSIVVIVASTIFPFLTILLAQVVISRIIVFGFSRRLAAYLSSPYNLDGAILFSIVSILPLLVHWIMCLHATYITANSNVVATEEHSFKDNTNEAGQDFRDSVRYTKSALEEHVLEPSEFVTYSGQVIYKKGRSYFVGDNVQPYMSLEVAQRAIDRGDV